jgi:release factor glutamine methyltransferase
VLGEWGFRRLTLTVDERALVPRPETEIVVERCLALLDGRHAPRVLDVGTGSGAIALALADEAPGAAVTGTDASPDALALARTNVERTGLRVELVEGDFRNGLPPGPWDLVVSNPPYVDPVERDSLAPEIGWEPACALYGAGAHTTIADAARGVLAEDGALVLEVGDGQGATVAAALEAAGYREVRAMLDLAGRDRVVEGRR